MRFRNDSATRGPQKVLDFADSPALCRKIGAFSRHRGKFRIATLRSGFSRTLSLPRDRYTNCGFWCPMTKSP